MCWNVEVLLDRVGVEEEVRRLHEEEPAVVGEMADRLAQERLHRPVVGVEHGDEVAGGMLKPVIEVAGLGVRVPRPRQVVHAELRESRCRSVRRRWAESEVRGSGLLTFWSVPPSSSSHTVSLSAG